MGALTRPCAVSSAASSGPVQRDSGTPAAGSNPATPTRLTGQFRSWNWPVLILYSSKDGAARAPPSPLCDRMTLRG